MLEQQGVRELSVRSRCAMLQVDSRILDSRKDECRIARIASICQDHFVEFELVVSLRIVVIGDTARAGRVRDLGYTVSPKYITPHMCPGNLQNARCTREASVLVRTI